MKIYSVLLIAFLVTSGIADKPNSAERISILTPGKKMVLSFRSEMQTKASGASSVSRVMIDKDGKQTVTETIEEKPAAGKGCTWVDRILLLDVTKTTPNELLDITMIIQKMSMGSITEIPGQETQKESQSFDSNNPTNSKFEYAEMIRDTKFIATVNAQNSVTSVDILGKYWAKKKTEYLKAGLSKEQMDFGFRIETIGVFSALDDVIAYLPQKKISQNISWKVQRKQVFPYDSYAFGMFTNGCMYCEENSTCTVKSLEKRGSDSIAVVSIKGKRTPSKPSPSMPERIKYFDVKGELTVNLTTGAVEKLCLEESPKWINAEDKQLGLKFVTTVSLKPAE